MLCRDSDRSDHRAMIPQQFIVRMHELPAAKKKKKQNTAFHWSTVKDVLVVAGKRNTGSARQPIGTTHPLDFPTYMY